MGDKDYGTWFTAQHAVSRDNINTLFGIQAKDPYFSAVGAAETSDTARKKLLKAGVNVGAVFSEFNNAEEDATNVPTAVHSLFPGGHCDDCKEAKEIGGEELTAPPQAVV
jgi:hypothetical protein